MEYPLYGSTFNLYRASPLYHGSDHVFDNLDLHTKRLRDNLAGDRARSLLLTDLQPEIAGTGSLETCQWTLLGDELAWERQQQDGAIAEPTSDNARGIHIHLKFERARYSALLLGDRSRMAGTPGFTSLPLILLRMPTTLRELFLDFISTTFDTRVSPMKLRSSFLSSSLEGLIEQTVAEDDEDAAINLEALSKGVGLQLSFPSAAPHLKSLDLVIAKDDIREFQSRGNTLWQQYQSRQGTEKDWQTRPKSNITGPFTAAISTYLNNHTAIELDNPAIVLSKVALGPFALSGEGKVKVLSTSAASEQFWDELIREAYGSGLEGINKTAAVAAQGASTRAGSRKPRNTSVPSEPPPPYELHDPARQSRR